MPRIRWRYLDSLTIDGFATALITLNFEKPRLRTHGIPSIAPFITTNPMYPQSANQIRAAQKRRAYGAPTTLSKITTPLTMVTDQFLSRMTSE